MSTSKEITNESDKLFNIITLGESGVGKTSIIKRYIYKSFEDDTISTIGLNYTFKEVILENGIKLKIKLVDTAGQERYRALNKNYFKNGDAVLYVFSLDKKGSFDKIREWKNMFNEIKSEEGIPTFLIRNKNDLDVDPIGNELEDINEEIISKFSQDYNFTKYVQSSAKDNTNIDYIFQEISEMWYNSNKNKKKKQITKTLQNQKKKDEKLRKKQNGCDLCKKDI